MILHLFLYLKVCLKQRFVEFFCLPFSDLIQEVEKCPLCRVTVVLCGTMWYYLWYYLVLCVVLCDCLICIKPVSIGLLTCNYMLANKTTHTWHVRLSSFSLDGSTWDNYICQSIIYMYLLFGWSLLFQWFDWMFR